MFSLFLSNLFSERSLKTQSVSLFLCTILHTYSVNYSYWISIYILCVSFCKSLYVCRRCVCHVCENTAITIEQIIQLRVQVTTAEYCATHISWLFESVLHLFFSRYLHMLEWSWFACFNTEALLTILNLYKFSTYGSFQRTDSRHMGNLSRNNGDANMQIQNIVHIGE